MATEIFAKPVLASSTALSPVLSALHLRLPRFILAELNTHRIKSKNSRSSRAVPIKTMIREAVENPVIPIHWGLAQRGMQAYEENNRPIIIEELTTGYDDLVKVEITNVDAWLRARDAAVYWAERFAESDYHKQVVNRLLEPFLHVDSLVSSTTWANFDWLRAHHAAEPHIQELARCVAEALRTQTVRDLKPGEWHLPYIEKADVDAVFRQLQPNGIFIDPHHREEVTAVLKQISAARCARISYKPFDGNGSIDAEIVRFKSLIESDRVHASPVEHQATPDTQSLYSVYRGETFIAARSGMQFDNPELHGNFQGWIQYRKTIPNEAVW